MGKVLNNISLSLLIFLITISWVRYLTDVEWLALISAIATTTLYLTIAITSNSDKTPRTPLTDSLAIYLATTDNSVDVINNLLKYNLYQTHHINHNTMLATRDNIDTLVHCHSLPTALDDRVAVNLCKIALAHNINTITIIASDISTTASLILSYNNINIQHINIATLYIHLQKANLLPPLHPIKSKKKGIVSQYALSRHRSKHYAISAIFLVIISFLSHLPLYTLVWATILLALALYSRFNTRYNQVSSRLDII